MSWVYTIMAVLLVIPFIHIAFILLYKYNTYRTIVDKILKNISKDHSRDFDWFPALA